MSDEIKRETAGQADPAASSHHVVRYGTAAFAAAVGFLYLLIALQVIHVAETTGKDSPFVPMMAAAVAFWVGAALLMLVDRSLVWVLGCAVQLVVLIGYFVVAPSRDPHYEAWGVIIKAAEVLILGSLLYLTLATVRRSRATA